MSKIDRIQSGENLNQNDSLIGKKKLESKIKSKSTEVSEALAGTNKDSILEKTIDTAKKQAKKDAQRIKDNWQEGGVGYIKSGGDAIAGTVNIANKPLEFVRDMNKELVDNLRTGNDVADKIIADGAGKALTGGGSAVTGAVDIVGSIFSSEEGSTKKAAQETWDGIKDIGEGVKNFGIGAAEATWEGAKTAGNFGLGIVGKGWLWGSDGDKTDEKVDEKADKKADEKADKKTDEKADKKTDEKAKGKSSAPTTSVPNAQNQVSDGTENFTPIELVAEIDEMPLPTDDDDIAETVKQDEVSRNDVSVNQGDKSGSTKSFTGSKLSKPKMPPTTNSNDATKQPPNTGELNKTNRSAKKVDISSPLIPEAKTSSEIPLAQTNTSPGRRIEKEPVSIKASENFTFTIPIDEEPPEPENTRIYNWNDVEKVNKQLKELSYNYKTEYASFLKEQGGKSIYSIGEDAVQDDDLIRLAIISDKSISEKLYDTLYPLNTDRKRTEAAAFIKEQSRNLGIQPVNLPEKKEDFIKLVKQNNIKLHLWNDDSISTDVPPDYVAPKNDIKSLLDDLEKDDKASSGINSDKNKKDIINHNGATKKQAASKKGKLPPKVKTPQAQNSSKKKVAVVKKQKSSTPSSRQIKDKKVIGETKNLRGKSNEKNLKFPNKTENAKNTGKATPPVNRPAESPKVINNANSVNKSSQTPKLKQSIEVPSNLMSQTRPLSKELKDAVNMIKEAKYEDYKDRYFKYLHSEAGGEDITSISIYTDTAPSALRQLMLSDYAYMVRLADTFFPLKEGTSNPDLEIFIDNVGLMCGERNLEIPRTKEEFLKLIKTKLYK